MIDLTNEVALNAIIDGQQQEDWPALARPIVVPTPAAPVPLWDLYESFLENNER